MSQFSKNLFWDIDFSQVDMDTHLSQIIQRVLEYGRINDWKIILSYYGLDKIVVVCKGLRTLAPVCLSVICTISDTEESNYRCYHFKQSPPHTWELLRAIMAEPLFAD